MIDLKIKLAEGAKAPMYANSGDAGMDVFANNEITLKPGERGLVKTGVYAELLEGYELQMRPRSGLALKSGITVLNTPGTIDAGYRGEIGVILINHSDVDFVVKRYDKVAQMVISPVLKANCIVVDSIDENTDRGTGGYGSTGVASN